MDGRSAKLARHQLDQVDVTAAERSDGLHDECDEYDDGSAEGEGEDEDLLCRESTSDDEDDGRRAQRHDDYMFKLALVQYREHLAAEDPASPQAAKLRKRMSMLIYRRECELAAAGDRLPVRLVREARRLLAERKAALDSNAAGWEPDDEQAMRALTELSSLLDRAAPAGGPAVRS